MIGARDVAVAALLLCGCARKEGTEPRERPGPSALTVVVARPTASSPALHWTAPETWTARETRTRMRTAEYTVPAAAGDPDDVECFVITFPGGQGGSVEQNITRWTQQFEGSRVLDQRSRDVAGMKATFVDVTGTYHPMAMPAEPVVPAKPGYRMLGAIVETKTGPWFFKMTGPAASVAQAKDAFDKWVESARE